MKSLALGLLTLTAAVFPAAADQGLPPVASMTCQQLEAELTVSGMQMASQLDPNFLADTQRGAAEIQASVDAAMAKVPGMTATGIACSVGNLAACAVNEAQSAEMQAAAERNTPRANAFAERSMAGVMASMRGMDMERMEALAARAESLNCPMPE